MGEIRDLLLECRNFRDPAGQPGFVHSQTLAMSILTLPCTCTIRYVFFRSILPESDKAIKIPALRSFLTDWSDRKEEPGNAIVLNFLSINGVRISGPLLFIRSFLHFEKSYVVAKKAILKRSLFEKRLQLNNFYTAVFGFILRGVVGGHRFAFAGPFGLEAGGVDAELTGQCGFD